MRFRLPILMLLIVSVSPSTPGAQQQQALRDAMAARLEIWVRDRGVWRVVAAQVNLAKQ
jgi:hypothetical protein